MSYRTRRVEWHLLMLLSVATALAGCAKNWQPRNYANPEALFRASLLEFQRRNWDNAQLGFEQLASDLSARDPLLAPAYFYLALTHEQQKEFLLRQQLAAIRKELGEGEPEGSDDYRSRVEAAWEAWSSDLPA